MRYHFSYLFCISIISWVRPHFWLKWDPLWDNFEMGLIHLGYCCDHYVSSSWNSPKSRIKIISWKYCELIFDTWNEIKWSMNQYNMVKQRNEITIQKIPYHEKYHHNYKPISSDSFFSQQQQSNDQNVILFEYPLLLLPICFHQNTMFNQIKQQPMKVVVATSRKRAQKFNQKID